MATNRPTHAPRRAARASRPGRRSGDGGRTRRASTAGWPSGRPRGRSAIAPTYPAIASAYGSRVVTRRATTIQATPAPASSARFAIRSRASTRPSLPTGPVGVGAVGVPARGPPRGRSRRVQLQVAARRPVGRRVPTLPGSGESLGPDPEVRRPPAGPLRADDVGRPVVADVEDLARGSGSPERVAGRREDRRVGLDRPDPLRDDDAAQVRRPAGGLDVAVDRRRERPVRQDRERGSAARARRAARPRPATAAARATNAREYTSTTNATSVGRRSAGRRPRRPSASSGGGGGMPRSRARIRTSALGEVDLAELRDLLAELALALLGPDAADLVRVERPEARGDAARRLPDHLAQARRPGPGRACCRSRG